MLGFATVILDTLGNTTHASRLRVIHLIRRDTLLLSEQSGASSAFYAGGST